MIGEYRFQSGGRFRRELELNREVTVDSPQNSVRRMFSIGLRLSKPPFGDPGGIRSEAHQKVERQIRYCRVMLKLRNSDVL